MMITIKTIAAATALAIAMVAAAIIVMPELAQAQTPSAGDDMTTPQIVSLSLKCSRSRSCDETAPADVIRLVATVNRGKVDLGPVTRIVSEVNLMKYQGRHRLFVCDSGVCRQTKNKKVRAGTPTRFVVRTIPDLSDPRLDTYTYMQSGFVKFEIGALPNCDSCQYASNSPGIIINNDGTAVANVALRMPIPLDQWLDEWFWWWRLYRGFWPD